MYVINMPSSITIDYKIVNNIIQQFSEIDSEDTHREILLDFTETTWLSAEMSTFIGNMVNTYQKKGFKLMNGGLNHEKVQNILERNGFLEMYGLGTLSPDKNNSVIPYKIIQSTNDDEIDAYLEDYVFSQVHRRIDKNEIEKIRNAVYEIAHNVKDHSEKSNIIICGQYFFKNKCVSITLSDNGITIPIKIKNKFKSKQKNNDFDIIDWATEFGNSTKHTASSGLGLFDIKENLLGIGDLHILSNKGYWAQKIDGTQIRRELSSPYPGTLIRINFCQNDHPKRLNNEINDIINTNTDFFF